MVSVEQMIAAVSLPEEHRELVSQFLLVFSRFEAALKRAGGRGRRRIFPRIGERNTPTSSRKLTPAQRYATMSAIRSKNTEPEHAVRRTLRKLGILHRSHAEELPGRPDFVLRRRQVVLM